jgi:hypothetical protein
MDILPPPAGSRAGAAPAPAAIAGYVVAAAVWAPSVHNTQPWSFRADGPRISLFADAGRQLRVADPDGREMMISCGAALFTARLALRSLGYIPQTSLLPDPGQPRLAARISWPRRAAPTGYERRLFGQVLLRRTHRGGFDPVPLAPEFLAALGAGAERDGAALRTVTAPADQAVFAAAVQEAERMVRRDRAHLAELVAWAPPPGSPRRDGVPPTAYPVHAEPTRPDFPSRDFAHGCGWGGYPAYPARSRTAGVLGLLTTAQDRPLDWLKAGQALQRALLASTSCGVAVALHSQPLEVPRLRGFIRDRLGDGSYPQLMLRLGTVIQTAASVRRPPASVLVAEGGQPGAGYA